MAASSEVRRIRDVIALSHVPPDWLLLDEFPLDGGKRKAGTPKIDLLAIKVLARGRHRPLTREAYEIKTSRQDFLYELRHPEKRQKAYSACNYYWFAVPEGLVQPEEVPSECGLISVSDGLACPIVEKSAEALKTDPPSPDFMVDVARRAYQVGRRDGASACAFERFDMLTNLAFMLIENKASALERKRAVLAMSRAIAAMQRHDEARELARIAAGREPMESWFVSRRLSSD